MERIYIYGETVKFNFEFVDLEGEPVEVSNVKFKVYDEAYTQIGTTITLTASNRTDVGKYFVNYVIPNYEGQIYVECSASNGTLTDIKRLELKTAFYVDKPVIDLQEGENTYITLDDANILLMSRLNTDAWDFASDADKSRALILATERIDNLRLKGVKAIYTQRLAFPRIFRSQAADNLGLIVPTVIPNDVQTAVCIEAVEILKGSKDNQHGVKSVTIGNFSQTFTESSNVLQSNEVSEIMAKYLARVVGLS